MAETTVAETTLAEVMAELAALEDPKIREVNEKHGDDHGRNFGMLRGLTRRLKIRQELARQISETDVVEAQMKDAPDRLQWAMNNGLAQIGIEHAEHPTRAIDIGECLEVLEDYPTPPNCASPYAPIWITEMMRRQDSDR